MSPDAIPETMAAMVLTGHGGTDKLVYCGDIAIPEPAPGEILVKVTAPAKSNTDRKVREGLYPTTDPQDVTSLWLTGGRHHAGQELVDNTTTGRSYVPARSELVANCDDPMVDCWHLRAVLLPGD